MSSAYVHVRAVAMYNAKTHGNSGKRELSSAYKAKLGQLSCTLQKHMATASFGCGLGDGRVGEVINAHTPASFVCVKLVCGRIAKRPHTSPLCVRENWCVGQLLNTHTPAPRVAKKDVWATG